MAASAGEIFKPADICKQSGIYQVIHDPAHVQEHEVTCVSRKKFPPCRDCHHPRFVLIKAAHHIERHELFKGR
jgi:hypothetical protein